MAWAIITIYISKCAQMNPQQLVKTSKFYSRCKMCDIEKTLGGVGTSPHPLLVARRLTYMYLPYLRFLHESIFIIFSSYLTTVTHLSSRPTFTVLFNEPFYTEK